METIPKLVGKIGIGMRFELGKKKPDSQPLLAYLFIEYDQRPFRLAKE